MINEIIKKEMFTKRDIFVNKRLPLEIFFEYIDEICYENNILLSSNFSRHVDKESVVVNGFYDPYDDEFSDDPSIEIALVFSRHNSVVSFSKEEFENFVNDFFTTLGHELTHQKQYRKRNFVITEQEKSYLEKTDEIGAYAYSIAYQLLINFEYDKKESLQFLSHLPRSNMKNILNFSTDLFGYTEEFENDSVVMKRLNKKVFKIINSYNINV